MAAGFLARPGPEWLQQEAKLPQLAGYAGCRILEASVCNCYLGLKVAAGLQGLKVLGGLAALGGGAYLYTGGDFSKLFGNAAGPALMEVYIFELFTRGISFEHNRCLIIPEMMQSKSKEGDYKSVREAIVAKLETDDYDDGTTWRFLEVQLV